MTTTYKQKITQAFRDNAIRSVLLIDDDYLPYAKLSEGSKALSEKIAEINAIPSKESEQKEIKLKELYEINTNLEKTETAKNFVNFFHEQKKLCDIESNTESLDAEKIRKSDLIVLDYHLNPEREGNEANSSLKIISDLSKNKHMNIVVVYTNEDLKKVWLEIGCVLKGSLKKGELSDIDGVSWEANHKEWQGIWDTLIFEKSMIKDYLSGNFNENETLQKLQESLDNEELPTKEHMWMLLEQSLTEFNKINTDLSHFEVHGSEEKWIQAGNVFVALKSKCTSDVPSNIWDCIEESLHDWNPSFYRLVTSELQNQIEDANLSMEKVLSKEKVEQISALWGILRVASDERCNAAKELLSGLLNDVTEKVQNESSLINFISSTATSTSDTFPEFSDNKDKYNKYIEKVLHIATNNYDGTNSPLTKDLKCQIVHAFNEQLCTIKEEISYISTGVVIKDISDDGCYYLCIAPSCNTIPNQFTGGSLAKDMAPHRAMRFIKLTIENDLGKALKLAHQSDTIFISDNKNRLALKIYEGKDTLLIEQGVVVNHDELVNDNTNKDIQFFVTDPESRELTVLTRKFQPIAKLRAGFASRYQNTQLQYEARIGVDYVSATLS